MYHRLFAMRLDRPFSLISPGFRFLSSGRINLIIRPLCCCRPEKFFFFLLLRSSLSLSGAGLSDTQREKRILGCLLHIGCDISTVDVGRDELKEVDRVGGGCSRSTATGSRKVRKGGPSGRDPSRQLSSRHFPIMNTMWNRHEKERKKIFAPHPPSCSDSHSNEIVPFERRTAN